MKITFTNNNGTEHTLELSHHVYNGYTVTYDNVPLMTYGPLFKMEEKVGKALNLLQGEQTVKVEPGEDWESTFDTLDIPREIIGVASEKIRKEFFAWGGQGMFVQALAKLAA